jgi:thiamine pyrophosphate-dependent acetolactate synthase large subunit-like protein
VLIDITKDAQQSSCVFDWDAAAPAASVVRHVPTARESSMRQALEMIRSRATPGRACRPRPAARRGHEEFRQFIDATAFRPRSPCSVSAVCRPRIPTTSA